MHAKSLIWGLVLGVLLSAIAAVIYTHVRALPTTLPVSIAPSARALVTDVACSVDRAGEGTADGYLRVNAFQYTGTVKVTVDFYAGGQTVRSNSGYVDTTDRSVVGPPGSTQSFSVVGMPALGAPAPIPTACFVTASKNYGSTLKNAPLSG